MAGKPTEEGSGSPLGVATLTCPSCGASVAMRAQGQTLAVACASCGTVLDPSDSKVAVLCEQASSAKLQSPIPIGARGTLRGRDYEAIGALRRCDRSGVYEWDEVLLWNPVLGFRWLNLFNGHWTLFTTLRTKPKTSREKATHQGKQFAIFEKGQARVIAVIGEMYWRVKVGDSTRVADYIRPPEMLSSEQDEDEIVWSLGEYIEPHEIRAAFALTRGQTSRLGVGPNQPNPHATVWPDLRFGLGVVAGLLLTIHLSLSGSGRQVFEQEFIHETGKAPATLISRSFDVTDAHGNLDLELSAEIANGWAGFGVTLINESSNEAFQGEKEISHYRGYDSDGPWEEGGTRASLIFPGIDPGRYHFEIEPTLGDGLPRVLIHARVMRAATIWINFILAIAAVLVFPLLVKWREVSFETDRWANSDYGGPSGVNWNDAAQVDLGVLDV